MKVLMFGWEFPPKIYGGLAVASYGITKGLSLQGCQAGSLTGAVASEKVTEALKG